MLTVGNKISDFELPGLHKGETKTFKLANSRGRWVILHFYPADFTAVSASEIVVWHHLEGSLRKLGCDLLAISSDTIYAHQAWVREIGDIAIPLLSDTNRRLIHQVGLLDDLTGLSQAATVILDNTGTIRHILATSPLIGRKPSEILTLVGLLQEGKPQPLDWQAEEPVAL